MKARSGQVALYLVLTLVAIVVLVLMNVGTFLAVSARNRTMNGGDAAALSVARHQGELLNRIGRANIDHLKAALASDGVECERIAEEQLRTCFLGPLEGIRIGNLAAKESGCEKNEAMSAILRAHASRVRLYYRTNPTLYPEPWEGAWNEYATRLEVAIADGIWSGPDNIDFLDAALGHELLNPNFYSAIAGKTWCWFRFYAPSLLDAYGSFRDWAPVSGTSVEDRLGKCVNSEIYSLGLRVRVGSARELLGDELIARLTGATEDEIIRASLLSDRSQKWFFYDEYVWGPWTELSPTSNFPTMGSVKPEYDVRGAAAICRVTSSFVNLTMNEFERESVWSAAAKPFGVVRDEEGLSRVVTYDRGFVTDVFTDVRLVPIDSVGGADLSTADPAWMNHVANHLGDYLRRGPSHAGTCWYCDQLVKWENTVFRSEGRNWLRFHADDCVRPSGSGGGRGGTPHGH